MIFIESNHQFVKKKPLTKKIESDACRIPNTTKSHDYVVPWKPHASFLKACERTKIFTLSELLLVCF